MSCPAQNVPLKARLDALDGDIELPTSFYALTVAMIAVVVGLPLLYRKLWVILFDAIFDIREAIILPKPPRGCQQYGKLATRNLSKETFTDVKDDQYPRHDNFPDLDNGEMESTAASPKYKDSRLSGRIEALYIHAIKSTHAIEVQSATVSTLGFAYDRLFSFAQKTKSIPDPQTGKLSELWVFLTQRSHPRLQLVKTEVWIPDPSDPGYDEEDEWVKNGGCIIVRFPNVNNVDFSYNGMLSILNLLAYKIRARSLIAEPQFEFRIPLSPTIERAKEKSYPVERMKIWRETPDSWNMSPEIPDEVMVKLKRFLGVSNPFTLFRIRPGFERELYKCAPSAEKLGYQPVVGFQDGVSLITVI
jgi:MOSC N-terminal beta barrel domain